MEPGVEVEPADEARAARRDDEAHGPLLAADRLAERRARLSEREVERGRLERPAPVVGLPRLQQRVRVERVLADERELGGPLLKLLLHVGVVVDVLATSLLAGAAQHDDGATQRELARDLARERLERVALDRERQVLDGVVRGHAREPTSEVRG